MTRRIRNLVLLPALFWAPPALAQQIITLPAGSWATDISPDGEVVVGGYGGDSFVWRWRVDPTPTTFPGGYAVAVSDDGTVIAGTIHDPGVGADVAAIWTAANGWQSLGYLPNALNCPSRSTAYDISGDGTTVVGLSWDGCNGRGFRWTAATGMQELQELANGHNRCSAISGNGASLGGFAQGTFNRTPAYWAPDTSGFVLDEDFQGEVHGFNESGSLSVGTNYFGGSNYGAFIRNQQTGVFTNLGNLNPGWGGNAADISEDAQVVVGYDVNLLAREAWVWTPASGIVSLNDRLLAAGVINAPTLLVANSCSDDGNVIVGGGEATVGFGFAAFIVELATPPSTTQFASLGNALFGSNGVPKLTGTGPLTPGTPTSITLTNGKSNGNSWFVIGLSAINAPFKGGIFVPKNDLVFNNVPLSGAGAASLQFVWPNGLPSGFSTYWQVWISDPVGPVGFAASNGLKSTTP